MGGQNNTEWLEALLPYKRIKTGDYGEILWLKITQTSLGLPDCIQHERFVHQQYQNHFSEQLKTNPRTSKLFQYNRVCPKKRKSLRINIQSIHI